MDDPSLLPFLNNNNGHGHHYAMDIEDDIEHEEDEIEEDEEDVHEQQYPEDEIDEDDLEDDEDEREILLPPPQPLPERGGRRKGTPRRLQLSPPIVNPIPAPQQRLLPLTTGKSSSGVHHHDQLILTSDQEDEDLNNENDYTHPKPTNGFEYLDEDEYDENNNMNYNDEENIYEIVDDILADIVTIIVRDIRQQRSKNFKRRMIPSQQTNGHSKAKGHIISNGKDLIPSNNINSPTKSTDPSTLFHEITKMMHLNSQSQSVKHKQSPSSLSATFSPPSSAKRQKTSELSAIPSLSHQQLLWQMTQQLMMSTQANETDSSSLLKQQLLGLTPPGTIPKRVGRPPKQQTQPPQVMRSSTNMIPPTSHSASSTSSFDRATNFAPRRRGRPPKYVTERGAIPGLPSHELDPSSYDQLFAAIENSVTGNTSRTSSAAFQSALASMLGHQSSLPLPIPSAVNRNGAPASMVKQSAGQTRHSLPASKLSHGLEMPLMATKKRGPGRPPKSQMLIDSHQVLQATKRINSSSSSSNNNNHFPPTMVPTSPSSFNLNAAFVEMLQQQQHPR